MVSHNLNIFQVERSYYENCNGDVLATGTVTIDDNDGQLDKNVSLDPDGHQTIAISGESAVWKYKIQFLDYAQVNGSGPDYELYAAKVRFNDGSTKYYVLSKDPGFAPSVGDSLEVTTYSSFTTTSYEELEEASGVCFTPGILIDTPTGGIPVERLSAGDVVITEDDGPQPVIWAGKTKLTVAQLQRQPKLAPIRVAARSFGNRRDLVLSPQHRLLCHFGAPASWELPPQTLISARHVHKFLGEADRVFPERGVEYIHLLFERHQLIRAEGALCESLYLGPISWKTLGSRDRREISRLFPNGPTSDDLSVAMAPVRPFLSGRHIRNSLAQRGTTQAFSSSSLRTNVANASPRFSKFGY